MKICPIRTNQTSKFEWMLNNIRTENIILAPIWAKKSFFGGFSSFFFFFLNWDSPYARLNSHYEAWSYKKRSTKRLKHTGNLFRKNLQLKDVC